MLGQTEYGQWYQLSVCHHQEWIALADGDNHPVRYYNLPMVKAKAESLRLTPGIDDVMITKVECSAVYDVVTRNRMLHTVYTCIEIDK